MTISLPVTLEEKTMILEALEDFWRVRKDLTSAQCGDEETAACVREEGAAACALMEKLSIGGDLVMGPLTPEQIAYAACQVRGDFAGFAALGDLIDHNILLPFAENADVNDNETLRFYESLQSEVTARILSARK